MKTIVMMVAILLVAVINTEAGNPPKQGGTANAQPGPPSLKPRLRCSGFSSDVAFFLKVTNDGPGDLPKGARIAYSYTTSTGKHSYSQWTLDSGLDVNQSANILINGAWNTVVAACQCYVK
jgi:hypothetical protein